MTSPIETIMRPHYYWLTYAMQERDQREQVENQALPPAYQNALCILCKQVKTDRIYRHVHCLSPYHLECLNHYTLQTRSINCLTCNTEIVVGKNHYISQWILFVLITTILQESLVGLKAIIKQKEPNLPLFLFGLSIGLSAKNNYDMTKIHGPFRHGVWLSASLTIILIYSAAITNSEKILSDSFDLSAGIFAAAPILIAFSNSTPLSHVKLTAASISLSIPFIFQLILGEHLQTHHTFQETLFFFEFIISMMTIASYCPPSIKRE